MTNEEREKEIRKQSIPNKEECIAFYKELTKLADVRFVPYYNMAIKALEQQPCEDCINKAEVINTIHKTIYGFFDIADDDSEEPINDKDELLLTINKAISNAVKALPPVTSSRPKGRWISHIEHCEMLGLKPSGLGAYEWCSNCDCGIDIDEFHRIHYNFCPDCGADMREREHKE